MKEIILNISGDHRFIKRADIVLVLVSNLSALFTAMVIGLVMPFFTGYETYAGYRVYTLYIGFASLFHLGFTDGIALRYGALDYRKLPAERFRAYLPFLTLIQLGAQILLFGILFTVQGKGAFTSPFFYVILNLLFTNIRNYYSIVDRFSGRFRTDSILNLLYGIFLMGGYTFLIFRGSDFFGDYLKYTTVLNAVAVTVYILRNREITFGRTKDEKGVSFVGEALKADLAENIRRGSFVMFSELTGILILALDSIFVQVFFDDRMFSEYSFAVYIIVAAYTLMRAVDNLIFPYLKRLDKKALSERFGILSRAVIQCSALMMGGLLVCRHLVAFFMPNYEGSCSILMILGITLLFRAMQGLVYGNFFRALDMEKIFFKNNLCICALAVLTNLAVCLFLKDSRLVAAASVLVYAFWQVLSVVRLRKKLDTEPDRFGIVVLCVTAVLFYTAAYWSGIAGTVLYLMIVAVCIVLGIVNWKKRKQNC